eukprot:4579532-Pyramimonas_sp.AAC.1
MRLVLTRAGLDSVRLNLIKGVCDICRERRAWGKPGHAIVPSSAPPGKFTECDLMLYKQEHETCHSIDRCIRYATGMEIPEKTITSILDAHHQCWMRFGPAK